MLTRRHFLAGLSTAAAATWLQPLRAAAGDPAKDPLLGHGRFRYRANKNWVPPAKAVITRS